MTAFFIALYLLLVIGIGFWSSRKQSSQDYMIADRNIGTWTFVGTTIASIVGSGLLVAYTAYVYEFGLGMLGMIPGLALGYLLFARVAPRLRREAKEHDFHSMADFFHHHFKGRAGHLISFNVLLLTSLSILNQFVAGTHVLSAISGYSYELSLLISAGVILLYLLLGGFRSVVRTDFFQYIVLILLVLLLGGQMVNITEVPFTELVKNDTPTSLAVASAIYGFFLIWAAPDAWQRVYSAKSNKVVRRGFSIAAPFLFAIGTGITLIAASIRFGIPEVDPAQSFVLGIQELLTPGFASLGAILLFAAVMSSADTMTFVFASTFAKDVLKQKNKDTSDLRKQTRWTLLVVVLLATLAAFFFRSVINITLIAVGISMSMTPSIMASLKWKPNPSLIMGSIAMGLANTVLWIALGKLEVANMMLSLFIAGFYLLMGQGILKVLKPKQK